MARRTKDSPDFFDENPFDPVNAATGAGSKRSLGNKGKDPGTEKRKAGFYLSIDILDRFNRQFYKLKLKGPAVENKSALLEAALDFALDDIERGSDSRLLKRLRKPLRHKTLD